MIFHWFLSQPDAPHPEPAALCVPHVHFALKTPRSEPRIEGSALLIGGRLSCGNGVMRSFLFLSDREGTSAREVLAARPRGTVGFAVVPLGRGPLYIITSSALGGPSHDLVFRSEDGGRSWNERGEIPKGTSPHRASVVGFAPTARGRIGVATLHALATGESAWVCQSSGDGKVWRFEALEAAVETPSDAERSSKSEPKSSDVPVASVAPAISETQIPLFRCPGFSEPRPGALASLQAPKSILPRPVEARVAWALTK